MELADGKSKVIISHFFIINKKSFPGIEYSNLKIGDGKLCQDVAVGVTIDVTAAQTIVVVEITVVVVDLVTVVDSVIVVDLVTVVITSSHGSGYFYYSASVGAGVDLVDLVDLDASKNFIPSLI